MRGGERAVVEEDHHEVDRLVVAQVLELTLQPLGLLAGRDAQVGRDLVRDVVRVERDDADVLVTEAVDAGDGARVRPVVGQEEAGALAAVAVLRVPGLHVVVAVRHHPRHLRGDRLGLREERVPGGGVVRDLVGVQALSVRVGVADVAGVQVEGRVLGEDHVVVAGRVRADALVTEGGEGERLVHLAPHVLARGRGAEGAQGRHGLLRGGVEALVADAVVVRGVGLQVLQRDVQVVLVDRRAGRGERRRVQRAYLGGDLVAEVPRVLAEAQERLLHRRRDLPGDPELGVRLGTEGEVTTDRGDQRTVDAVGRGSRHQQRRGGRTAGAERTAHGEGPDGDGAGAQHPAAGEAAAQVLVLLGHAHTVGELLGHAHTWDIHARTFAAADCPHTDVR